MTSNASKCVFYYLSCAFRFFMNYFALILFFSLRAVLGSSSIVQEQYIQSVYSKIQDYCLCWESSETNSHVLLAHPDSHWPHLEASGTKTVCMCSQAGCDVAEVSPDIDLHVPQSLSDDTGSLGDLLVEGVLVAQLVPHARFSSNNVDVGDSGLELIHLPPILIDSISVAVEIAEADIEVGEVVVGEDDLVLPACHTVDVSTNAPPLDDVLVFHGDVDILVGPIDHFLLGGNRPPQLLLLLPEVDREGVIVADVIGLHPCHDSRSVPPAVVDDLVSSEVHVIIDEGGVGIAQDLFDDFPGHVYGGVELPLVFPIAVQGDVLVFFASAPRFGVGRGIYFRYNPHSPRLGVGDNSLEIVLRVDSSNTSRLTEFWDRGNVHGEGILISDMPMQDIQFRVHHHINGPLNGRDGEEVTGCIDHQSPPQI